MKRLTKLFSILGVTLIIGGFFLFNQLQVGNITVGLSFPCACPSSKDIISWEREKTINFLEEYYRKNNRYPEYVEINNLLVANSEYKVNLYTFYDGRKLARARQGVYYIVSKDQQRYEIQGYATATWNGIPIVINIESGLPQDAYTIDG